MTAESQVSNSTASIAPATSAQIGALIPPRVRRQFIVLSRLLWVLLAGFSLGVFIVSTESRWSQMIFVALENSAPLNALEIGRPLFPPYIVVWDTITMSVFAAVGILVYWRKPNEWIAWFASLTLITVGLTIVRPPDSLAFLDEWLHVPMLITIVIGVLALGLFIFIFPDGRFAPPWMLWVAIAFVLYTIGFYTFFAVSDSPMRWPPPGLSYIVMLGVLVGSVGQVFRYRRLFDPIQKQQTKWVVYGLAVGILGALAFLFIVPAIFDDVNHVGIARVAYIMLGVPFLYLAAMTFPLALSFSILRFRLWEIGIVVNRTIVYVLLTAILAGVFSASIIVAQKLFIALTGSESVWAGAVTTLFVVALITPIKDRLQNLVDLRYKESSDAVRTLLAFADQVRARVAQVQPQQITQRLLDVAVMAFRAEGGYAVLEKEGPLNVIFTSGEWLGDAEMSVVLEAVEGGTRLGMLALGPRTKGGAYSEYECQMLQTTARVVAHAILEDMTAQE
jgi:hypothetical protein